MKIIKETTTRVFYEDPNGYPGRATKCLCIGGPFAGQWKAGVQIEPEYVRYNRSSSFGRYSRDNPNARRSRRSQVFIHRDLL